MITTPTVVKNVLLSFPPIDIHIQEEAKFVTYRLPKVNRGT